MVKEYNMDFLGKVSSLKVSEDLLP